MTGRLRWRRPSTLPSLRLRSLTYQPDASGRAWASTWELVVLGGDVDGTAQLVTDRVVAPVVAKAEPGGRRAGGLAEHLVPEADAEDRDPARSSSRRASWT